MVIFTCACDRAADWQRYKWNAMHPGAVAHTRFLRPSGQRLAGDWWGDEQSILLQLWPCPHPDMEWSRWCAYSRSHSRLPRHTLHDTLERARELNKYSIKWLGDLWLDVLVFFEGLCDPSKCCPAEPLQGIWWQSHTATDLKLNFLNPLASIIWLVINRTKERWISQ